MQIRCYVPSEGNSILNNKNKFFKAGKGGIFLIYYHFLDLLYSYHMLPVRRLVLSNNAAFN